MMQLTGRLTAEDFVFVVWMEDELVHTDEHPFCNDVTCGCHSDAQLNQEFFMGPYMDGLLSKGEAERIWYAAHIWYSDLNA